MFETMSKSEQAAAVLLLASLFAAGGCAVALPRLSGRAVLPAATFAEGPHSGQLLGDEPIHGQPLPFESQPIQGFSALLPDAEEGTFLVMSDNGYGAMENSADYHLRVYRIRPSFETADGGTGEIEVLGYFELNDPDGHLPFVITHELVGDRILTGSDLDIESFRRAPDGTFWFGDELGPFLLHTDSSGRVLEPPLPLPDPENRDRDLRSPQSPLNEEGSFIRLMNAYRAHAWHHGATASPVLSPYHRLLIDGDTETAIADRREAGASSELIDVASLQLAGFGVVPWTVNAVERMEQLLELSVAGIITDHPERLRAALLAHRCPGELPADCPELLDGQGLVNRDNFDAQGHRGARGLRPENTLPAFEAALDHLMSTLETDVGLSADGVPLLNHDHDISLQRCRPGDEAEADVDVGVGADEDEDEDEDVDVDVDVDESPAPLLREHRAADLQARFVCDGLLPERRSQRNDHELSPVALAFAAAQGLPDPYVMPTLSQLFEFIAFYDAYYREGPGAEHPEATLRAANAARVRFNVEIKRDPTRPGRTADAEAFAAAVGAAITGADLESRADVQSFDHGTLLELQARFPTIRTAYLIGADSLQTDANGRSPWLAGLRWPQGMTASTHPFRVARSGGLEGMALSADGRRLLPMLEKPLLGSEGLGLFIFELELETRRFTERRWRYQLEAGATAIGAFLMFNEHQGLVIERDDAEGDLEAFKRIYAIELGDSGELVTKELLVDLMQIDDPQGISLPAEAGDVGLGRTFAMPFFTIECLAVLDATHLVVAMDNNYPFSVGRHVGSDRPDDNEIVVIELPEPLLIAENR